MEGIVEGSGTILLISLATTALDRLHKVLHVEVEGEEHCHVAIAHEHEILLIPSKEHYSDASFKTIPHTMHENTHQ